VALIGKLRFTGFIAWLMWLGLHLVYLTGFKNRVIALLHWTVSFVGRGRSERTATEQQIFARTALSRLQRGAADLVSRPAAYDGARDFVETNRRAELEAKAAEEARSPIRASAGCARRATPPRDGRLVPCAGRAA
jgi:NADH dehydrogenase